MLGAGYPPLVVPAVVPQLVANDGTRALRQAIADPGRFACEPKVDGVRGLVVYQPCRVIEMRNRRGEKRDWLRGNEFEARLRRMAERLPNLWQGTVLDGELTARADCSCFDSADRTVPCGARSAQRGPRRVADARCGVDLARRSSRIPEQRKRSSSWDGSHHPSRPLSAA